MLALGTSPVQDSDAEKARFAIAARVVADGIEEVTEVDVENAARSSAQYLLDRASLHRGSRVASADASVAVRLRRCGSDPRCVKAALVELELDAALLIAVNLTTSPVRCAFQVIHRDPATAPTTRLVELPYARPQLLAGVTDASAKLFAELGWPSGGRLVIESAPAGATVTGAGARATSPTVLTLASGPYDMTLSLDGYVTTSTQTHVRALTTNVWRATLEEEPTALSSPWVWAGGAVVVVAAALVVWRVADADPAGVCQTRDPGLCP